MLTKRDLRNFVSRLLSRLNHQDSRRDVQDSLVEECAYVAQALDAEGRADLFLACAEAEAEATEAYVQLADERGSQDRGSRDAEARMDLATRLTNACTPVSEHQLRGNLHFMKRYLASDD